MLFYIAIALIALPTLVDSAAYCTYHLYNAGDSLTTVACSDGANGIMTKFGYSTLSPMYPYVTAFSGATWNSPNCGRCVKVTSSRGNSVYLTVIDQCGGPPGGYDAHFDIAPPAFRELFGDAGVNAGVQSANWQFVDSSLCRGNKGNTGGPPPSTPPPSTPPPSGTRSTTRCGYSWGDANSKCGTPCTNDGPCGSQRCYADLSLNPCGARAFGEESSESDENYVDAANADETENYEAAQMDQLYDAATESGEIDANGEEGMYDAAAEGDAATLQSNPQTTEIQGWAVALLVLFSIIVVLLLAVVVLIATVLRRQQ